MYTEDSTTKYQLGGYPDEDEAFLKRLSVYATVRSGDLKRETDTRTNGYRSLENLLQEWNFSEEQRKTGDIAEETSDDVTLALRDHELLVKGFTIDERIAPGFRYRIRYINSDEYLYDGEARRLESIGLGYGRRMTFKGDSLNHNDCFFWSDSNPDGYAFCIEAVQESDVFAIVDCKGQEVGSVEIQSVDFPQVELDTFVEGKTVVKNVQARFSCAIKLHRLKNALVNVNTKEFEVAEGVAELVKERGSKEAYVRCIKDVFFQTLGKCTLHAER